MAATVVAGGSAYAGQVQSNNSLDFQVVASPTRANPGEKVTLTFNITNKEGYNALEWRNNVQQFGAITVDGVQGCTPTLAKGWEKPGFVPSGQTATLTCQVTAENTTATAVTKTIKATLSGMHSYNDRRHDGYIVDAVTATEILTINGTGGGGSDDGNPDDRNPDDGDDPQPGTDTEGGRSHGAVTSNQTWFAPNGITLTKTADKYLVDAGGENVTYTYTVKNNNTTNAYPYSLAWWKRAVYFTSMSDDKCARVRMNTGIDEWTSWQSGHEYYIKPGGTATFTCTTKVTADVTNTATAHFYDWGRNALTAQAKATVNVDRTIAVGSCNTLWASLGNYGSTLGGLATIETSGAYSLERQTTIDFFEGQERRNGSAAVAVDPSNPNLIYYVPRRTNAAGQNDVPGGAFSGLWRYDTSTKREQRLTPNVVQTARLGVDHTGTVWLIGNTGKLVSWNPTRGFSGNNEEVTLPNRRTFGTPTPTQKRLGSGDVVFDGLGNLWVIGSDQDTKEAHLYTIPHEDLTDGNGATAHLVGSMGFGEFNGLAFTEDGTLWATSRDVNSGTGALYIVNKETGSATRVSGNYPVMTEDLASCALPKPELRLNKSVEQTSLGDRGYQLDYTITAENIGTLSSTGTWMRDQLPANTQYVRGSTKLNGKEVRDHSATFPFANRIEIHSPGELDGIIAPGKKAVIEFSVIVATRYEGKEVCNQGVVSYVGSAETGVHTDDSLLPGEADQTCVTIPTPPTPEIGVDKKLYARGEDGQPTAELQAKANIGDEVTYTYYVSTDPNQPKAGPPESVPAKPGEQGYVIPGNEPLKNVTVKDNKCSPMTPVEADYTIGEASGFNTGDRNGDGLLDPGEIWEYTCTKTLTAGDFAADADDPALLEHTNTVTANGTGNKSGKDVDDQDTWTITTDAPQPVNIQLVKLGLNCDVGQPVCPLAGAEFALYDADPAQAGADGNYPQPIEHGFTRSTTGGATVEGVSVDTALFVSTDLEPNKDYWIVETKAPDGFTLLAQPIRFTIVEQTGEGGDKTQPKILLADAHKHGDLARVDTDDANAGVLRVLIYDATPAPLPEAGGDIPPHLFMLLGLSLVVLAAGYYGVGYYRAGYHRKTSGKRSH